MKRRDREARAWVCVRYRGGQSAAEEAEASFRRGWNVVVELGLDVVPVAEAERHHRSGAFEAGSRGAIRHRRRRWDLARWLVHVVLTIGAGALLASAWFTIFGDVRPVVVVVAGFGLLFLNFVNPVPKPKDPLNVYPEP